MFSANNILSDCFNGLNYFFQMKDVGNTVLNLTTTSDFIGELPEAAAAQIVARLNQIENAINSFPAPSCD